MLHVTINGHRHEFAPGLTLLDALRRLGADVPTLCHDDRLEPQGACRLCSVEVIGWSRYATACNTPLQDGMEILTHSPGIVAVRRTLLELLLENYPASATQEQPGKEFHLVLAEHGVRPRAPSGMGPGSKTKPDDSHSYIHVHMARCVACFRCVQICDAVQGQTVWRVWNRGSETEIRPDSGTTLRASSCVSCGACVDTCPTGAIEDKSVLALGEPAEWTRTVCPYCGVGCELEVGTREDRMVQVRPARGARVNQGHLCAKGRYAWGFVDAADRVTTPMIRVRGEWIHCSWPEALAHVTENLQRLRERHGSDSIGILGSSRATNEENYLTQKFARVVLGTNNVDCCARVCHAPSAAALGAMLGTGAATNSFDDIEEARAFLLCGTNTTESHPVVGARIKRAVRRGAKLVVIDPRRTELAACADVHLALRPGTNVPLLNALACVLVEEELVDLDAVRERLAGWSEFREFIHSYAPENVAEICGLEPRLIHEAARLYARVKPAMCFHGLGATEHTQGTDGVMCLVNLALLTGNIGRSGGGVNPLRGQNNVQGAAHMGCEPDYLTGMARLAEARRQFEDIWGAPVPSRAGLDLLQMIDAANEGRLKALWAIGYDVGLTNPNVTRTLSALRKVDFVIVQDLFLNTLARECGAVFLPATSSFEKDGTFMNSERRVQRVRRSLTPRGESRPDWEIICAVARAMGNGAQFEFRSVHEIWNEIRAVWPAGCGITYERLDCGGLQWPCPDEQHPGTTVLHRRALPGGARAMLQRIDYRATCETTSAEFPFLLITGRNLYQFNAGTMTMRTANADLRPADTVDVSPDDSEQLGLHPGDVVRIRSRYGEATLPARIDAGLKPGDVFATFHTAEAAINRVTSQERDRLTHTPEFKLTAVALEKSMRVLPADDAAEGGAA